MVKLKIFCLILHLLSFSSLTFANSSKQSFQFGDGDEVGIISDKAFRKTSENTFEAIGNVVISNQQETLYGEFATLDTVTGQVHVKGNVRYIGIGMTVYGSEMEYNFKNKFLAVTNARVIATDYTIIGKKIIRPTPDLMIGDETEYTTCRDCPESWSIYGKKITITLNEYLHIDNALIKVNNVPVMYLPYVVFPIKNQRQTGLLFPTFSVSFKDGLKYRQPWFWAIDNHSDLTLSPATHGKKGLGNEFEYRRVFGEDKWVELYSFHVNDRYYEPKSQKDEKSGKNYFRHYSDYEHHFNFGNHVNHHFFYNAAKDMDIIRDYDSYVLERLRGADYGGGGHLEIYQNNFFFNVESYFNRNILFNEPEEFDNSYVQISPEFNFGLVPIRLLKSSIPFFQSLTLGTNGSFTVFKQNHKKELSLIRNVNRTSTDTFLDWNMISLGPVNLKTNINFEHQYYQFTNEDEENYFRKYGTVFKTELSFEFDKVLGVAYSQDVPVNQFEDDEIKILKSTNKNLEPADETLNKMNQNLLGQLPKLSSRFTDDTVQISRNSYRHAVEYKLIHRLTPTDGYKGSSKFHNQIKSGSNGNRFDDKDILRDFSSKIGSNTQLTSIPEISSLELQWNNTLIKKSAKKFSVYDKNLQLKNSFKYATMATFNVSQGVDFNVEGETVYDQLTRLNVVSSFTVNKTSFTASEFYFYHTGNHLLDLALSQSEEYFTLSAGATYNSLNEQEVDKTYNLGWEILPISVLSLQGNYSFDLDEKRTLEQKYSIGYIPINNCWKFEIGYNRNLIDDPEIIFNFLINFSRNTFTSITGG